MFRCKTMFASVAILAVGAVFAIAPATSLAGRVGGALFVKGYAGPDDYESYTVRFEGGKMAHVFVKSIHRTDLDVKIIDPVTLQVVAQDLRAAKDAHVDFFPTKTREYIILVHNYNRDRGSAYVLRTN